MTQNIALPPTGPDTLVAPAATGPSGPLLLADGITPLPLHGFRVWQGRSWELAGILLGSMSLVWIAIPAA